MRLVANDAVAPQQRIDCEYDWQGRRISKKVWNNTAGSGNPVVHSKFVYDAGTSARKLTVSTLSPEPSSAVSCGEPTCPVPCRSWRSRRLLKFIYHATQSTNFVTYDGNGNVAALFDVSNNALLASYEYGPFGS